MSKYLKYFIATSTLFLAINVQAQEFRASATVNLDQLPLSARDGIITMQSDVLNYYNAQRFTGKDWEGAKIPLDVTIYLTGGNQQSRRFSARLFFNMKTNLDGGVSTPLMKILDKDWVFSYTLNQQFNYQTLKYDEFSTVLDFYNFIALGLDADCFEQLGGTKYFQNAREIVQLGAANTGPGYSLTVSEPGEFTRISLVTELLDQRYDEFRKLIFDYHADGLNLYAKDPATALKGVESVLSRMASYKTARITTRSYFIQMFFDAKQSELTQLFKGSNNSEVLRYLQILDPANYSVYEEAFRR